MLHYYLEKRRFISKKLAWWSKCIASKVGKNHGFTTNPSCGYFTAGISDAYVVKQTGGPWKVTMNTRTHISPVSNNILNTGTESACSFTFFHLVFTDYIKALTQRDTSSSSSFSSAVLDKVHAQAEMKSPCMHAYISFHKWTQKTGVIMCMTTVRLARLLTPSVNVGTRLSWEACIPIGVHRLWLLVVYSSSPFNIW